MNEEEKAAAAEKITADETAKKVAEAKAKELSNKSVEELINEIHSTRSEAKERRLKERLLEEEISKMKAAQKKIDDDKLIADGKLQELLDSKTIELTDIQSERDKFKLEAEESKKFKASKVEGYKTELGDKWNPDFENLSLIALDDLVAMTAGKNKINTDDGSNGEHSKINLTAEQKKEAYNRYPYISKERAEDNYKHNLIKQKEREKK